MDVSGWSAAADHLGAQAAPVNSPPSSPDSVEVVSNWGSAAEVLLVSSQTESEEIEEACAYRCSDSDEEGLGHDFIPEFFWLRPLMGVLHSHLGQEGANRLRLQVASACSGTLAEASVLQDWFGVRIRGCGVQQPGSAFTNNITSHKDLN